MLEQLNKTHIGLLDSKIDEENCSLVINTIDKLQDYDIGEHSAVYGLFNSATNELVGFIDIGEYKDGLIINNMVVFQGHKRKGYGRTLIKQSLKGEFDKNYHSCLYADVLYDKEIGFYERLGFENVEDYLYVKTLI